MWLYVKNWRKFEITEILYKIFANFLKRKEPAPEDASPKRGH